jgi:hypothetical protein
MHCGGEGRGGGTHFRFPSPPLRPCASLARRSLGGVGGEGGWREGAGGRVCHIHKQKNNYAPLSVDMRRYHPARAGSCSF